MGNYPFHEMEPYSLTENSYIISEEIDDNDSQIINSSDFRDIYSINNNFFDITQPNILPSPSSNTINDNPNNNNNIIKQSEKEKEIIILISNSNDIAITKNNNYINKKDLDMIN